MYEYKCIVCYNTIMQLSAFELGSGWILVPSNRIAMPEYTRRQNDLPVDVVIWLMYGDEGKGKIVDSLWWHGVRFNGGHNAGHTLVIDGINFDLHIIPSSIVSRDKLAIIARTCVVGLDLPKVRKDDESWTKFQVSSDGDIVCNHRLSDLQVRQDDGSIMKVWVFPELEQLRSKGVNPDGRLFISESAPLIGVHHVLLDALSEEVRDRLGARKIGSTGSGIAPAYGKTHSIIDQALEYAEWAREEYRELSESLKRLTEIRESITLWLALSSPDVYMAFVQAEWTIIVKYFPKISFDEIKREQFRKIAELRKAKNEWKIIIWDEREKIKALIGRGERIIGEWAQSVLISEGQSVYGTTSNPNIATFCEATGITEDQIANVFGVMKLPPSSVGTRPIDFMKYPKSDLLDSLRNKYKEFGVSTWRPRDIVKISLIEIARAVDLLLAWTSQSESLRDKIVPVLNRVDGLIDFSGLTGGRIPVVTGYTHHVWEEAHVWLHPKNFDWQTEIEINPKNLLTHYPKRNILGHPDMFSTSRESVIERVIGWDFSLDATRIGEGSHYIAQYVLAATFGKNNSREIIMWTGPRREDLVLARDIAPSR